MARELDCRGLTCPGPVMQVREILEKEHPATIVVSVDNEAAGENVSRFLEHHRYQVTVEQADDAIHVIGRYGEDGQCELMPPSQPKALSGDRKILVMVTTNRIGHGDDELGEALLRNFLETLPEMGPDLWRLILVNGGVKLAVRGSAAITALRRLADAGVSILVCGTCLNHFHLLDQKEVGETTNMLDIVTSLQLADSVLNV
ncbi:sulfurtransferase-like selenium metabolism protein YedF [Dissulfurirhabdus thermomarina]|uniref:Sulfurtransferase-like selenium metabolism protein YedF n=1 Tax=Dissulfurirhabdus thermomarina TaxID=1765737 RepID=A0A6N9TSK5_DISTH|nr:sulfurtransferase-like selenium metabolism protein YedF [Dissulfurirhabdus thermomarina]NDY42427.1 sulfurtransferase-like selenium metabolism protein YedF [Dissulfurirhabdus thermomarina]NMX23553.1 sulfurtransferase-like selenium metabolism protein YedF [Dissulfurirhabdus thermomarina]